MASAMADDPRKPSPPSPIIPPPSIPSDSPVRLFCDLISRLPASALGSALSRLSLTFPLLPSDVESVLSLSSSHPASAIIFFRWSALCLPHSPRSWNLVVYILGRNRLFEPMWDAIRSMKHDSALSLSTFVSAFDSYCAAAKVKEAVMTFDVMDRYGVPQDLAAVNALLRAICSTPDGHAAAAANFFDKVKARIAPDKDSFAILLKGWQREGNVKRAKTTFGEMIVRMGWDADNIAAYDAFLTTLVRASQVGEAVNFLKVMKSKNCLPGIEFLANTLDFLVRNNDALHAISLWNIMVTENSDGRILPNLHMYNTIISLLCDNSDYNSALGCLDAMPFHGVFPDTLTYNAVFECLIRIKKSREAERFLAEMKKNEKTLTPGNCAGAIRMFFEDFDPPTAIDVWNYFLEENVRPDEDCVEELLVGLSNLGRLTEVKKYVDDILDMGGRVRSATIEKLKDAFYKEGKHDRYNLIARRVERRLER